MNTLTRPQEKMWNALTGTGQANPLRLTRERVAAHIAQCDYGEEWYIHPVKIEWNPKRDEWAYEVNGYKMGHDHLENILGWSDPHTLVEFYKDQVRGY